ncbi:MAG: segregation and condensation protein A [Alphaproteobacteria bacterium]
MTTEPFAPESNVEEGWETPGDDERLVVDLEGFEGPLDLLLDLAKREKVDLTRISILELADQYLAFISRARQLRLELAADYLVMAAWLAYLKSRLLLPEPATDEPSAEEMAEALAFQLRRLDAMRDAATRLMARPQLGREVFARGAPEGTPVEREMKFAVTLFDLLKAYAEHRVRTGGATLRIESSAYFAVEEALERLARLVEHVRDWESLLRFLPAGVKGGLVFRSAVAATLTASLEMAREGKIRLRQTAPYGAIYLRKGSSPR